MESPPSVSTHSDVPPLSEDSGLLVTSGSFSSDSASGWHNVNPELQESDSDEKSVSLCRSTETLDRMCGDYFNTVKKGPSIVTSATIEPPPEFQDIPTTTVKMKYKRRSHNVQVHCPKPRTSAFYVPLTHRSVSPAFGNIFHDSLYERRQCQRYANPGLLHISPCRGGSGRLSKSSHALRLWSSHDSLIGEIQAANSEFITQATSHDALSADPSHIMDMYNVPFKSDIYAEPIDMVKNEQRVRRGKKQRSTKQRKSLSHATNKQREPKDGMSFVPISKRHSLPSSSCMPTPESNYNTENSVDRTLKEMRRYIQALYSSSSESDTKNKTNIRRGKNNCDAKSPVYHVHDTVSEAKVYLKEINDGDFRRSFKTNETNNNKCDKTDNAKNRKHKEKEQKRVETGDENNRGNEQRGRPLRVGLTLNLKKSIIKWFRRRRDGDRGAGASEDTAGDSAAAPVRRALPPLPETPLPAARSPDEENITDFATSIKKVKDCGWYWGPLSVETAEKILSDEPDGSFIVRDSSDDHYIFTLTFKLNGLRHVRIEHDQGNFCFGGCSMFRAQTIVEFIENAVETSRSGRYLFFLNLRPVVGPVRVQLLHPVSRFRKVQGLQHMCRFVILKFTRRDKISELPLPAPIIEYLNATHYYSELLADL